jgi:hypothetical protein
LSYVDRPYRLSSTGCGNNVSEKCGANPTLRLILGGIQIDHDRGCVVGEGMGTRGLQSSIFSSLISAV